MAIDLTGWNPIKSWDFGGDGGAAGSLLHNPGVGYRLQQGGYQYPMEITYDWINSLNNRGKGQWETLGKLREGEWQPENQTDDGATEYVTRWTPEGGTPIYYRNGQNYGNLTSYGDSDWLDRTGRSWKPSQSGMDVAGGKRSFWNMVPELAQMDFSTIGPDVLESDRYKEMIRQEMNGLNYATGELGLNRGSSPMAHIGGIANAIGQAVGPGLALYGAIGGLGTLLGGAAGGAGASAPGWVSGFDLAGGGALGGAGTAAGGVGAGIDFLAANDAITGGLSSLGAGGGGAGALSGLATGADTLATIGGISGAALPGAGAAATGSLADILSGNFVDLANSGGSLVPELPITPGTGLPNLPPTPPTGSGSSGGTQSPAPVQSGPTTPGTGPGGSAAPITTSTPGWKQWLAEKSGLSLGAIDALGTAATTLLGIYQANQSAGAASDLATQLQNYGAPSRARYEESYAPNFNLLTQGGYKAALDQLAKEQAAKWSPIVGNPAGSPGAQTEILDTVWNRGYIPILQNYRNQNASTGGYGAFNTAAPGAMANASGQDNSWMTVLGGGLNRLLNPPQQTDSNSLANVFAQLKAAGLV